MSVRHVLSLRECARGFCSVVHVLFFFLICLGLLLLLAYECFSWFTMVSDCFSADLFCCLGLEVKYLVSIHLVVNELACMKKGLDVAIMFFPPRYKKNVCAPDPSWFCFTFQNKLSAGLHCGYCCYNFQVSDVYLFPLF